MLSEKIESQRQAFFEVHARTPIESRSDAIVVGVVISNVYALAIRWKSSNLVASFSAVGLDNQVCQVLQADRPLAAEIKCAAVSFVAHRRCQQCVDCIVDEIEIAQLMTVPHFELLVLEQQANPKTQKSLARISYPHARTVSVGKS